MKNAVIGIIFNEKRDAVLILERRDVSVWVLPGGGIDAGETPEEAVVREVLEETGLRVKIIRKVAEYYPINRITRLTYAFECAVLEGSTTTGDETRSVGFYPIDKLPSSFFELHKEWLDDALANFDGVLSKPTQVTYGRIFWYFLRHPLKFIRFFLSRCGFPLNKF
ncbi:MAG: NUDIX domain-containing protein [Parachlamydiaceae bacterium]|nr:NUDIX domain-containing protein [Parachlamydiaceae bacterium]